ncbi:hypothetical protein JX266_004211 [Neoarthrinium moseri]|nr:hypothetical protein JX266_004211 [Neoarthrinium moseri]
MDPLSALAIAAAVIQFVDFGGRLLHKKWVRKLSPKDDESKQAAYHAPREEAELVRNTKELLQLVDDVRKCSKQFGPSQRSSLAEKQILKVCEDCEAVSSKFQNLIDDIRKSRPQRLTVDGTPRNQVGRELLDGILKKPAKVGTSQYPSIDYDGLALLGGIWTHDQIDGANRQLATIKHQMVTSMIFSLWEDSKEAKKRELHLCQQLEDLTAILGKVKISTMMSKHNLEIFDLSDQSSPISGMVEDLSRSLSEDQNIRTISPARKTKECIADALIPIIKAARTPGFTRVDEDIFSELDGDSPGLLKGIRQTLVDTIWNRKWIIDSDTIIPDGRPMAHQVNLTKLAEALITDLSYEAMGRREEAIPKNFRSTYQWIFHTTPPDGEGKLQWHNFPQWLEADSNTVYWITGKPGSGKSTMMKYITEHPSTAFHLEKWSAPLPPYIMKYYAWIGGNDMQKSWIGLKRSLLCQAFSIDNKLIPFVSPRRFMFAKIFRNPQQLPAWSSWEIEESFGRLLSQCGQSFKLALFVDGLDEFDMLPNQVLDLIREVTKVSQDCIKVCVASRPWTEFDDEFYGNPLLEMHLLTFDDLRSFVKTQLDENRGFDEMRRIYSEEADLLVDDVVTKARGVFLWVSLVMETLLECLTAGDSMTDLKDCIRALPLDISSLYDSIWARILPQNKAKASWMIQLSVASYGPLSSFSMWLAEEITSRKVRIDDLVGIKSLSVKTVKRRLASRTRGLLEIPEGGTFVDFPHRTARDWALQAHVWEDICSSYGENAYDPYMTLFEIHVLTIADRKEILDYSHGSFWIAIAKVLSYAYKAQATAANTPRLIELMDTLNVKSSTAYLSAQVAWPERDRTDNYHQHWYEKQRICSSKDSPKNTFVGLTAQFSIFPYVQEHIRRQVTDGRVSLGLTATKRTIGILENAVFGHKYFMDEGFDPPFELQPIATQERHQMVQFLVSQGATQAKTHSQAGFIDLVEELRRLGKLNAEDRDYYDKVEQSLKSRPKKGVKRRLILSILRLTR